MNEVALKLVDLAIANARRMYIAGEQVGVFYQEAQQNTMQTLTPVLTDGEDYANPLH